MIKPRFLVYEDGIIEVGLFAESDESEQNHLLNIGLRWLSPEPVINNENMLVEVTNIMGGDTSWFILPTDYSYAVARQLVEKKVSGTKGFFEDGFNRMIDWLVEMEQISNDMCY